MDSNTYNMDPFLRDSVGNELVPIWSLRQSTYWCSLNATPGDIQIHAMEYYADPPHLLRTTTARAIEDLDFTHLATWYKPDEHWLAWVPTAPLSVMRDDPVGYVFDSQDIDLVVDHADVYGYDSERSHDSPSRVFTGYFLDESWSNQIVLLGQRLYAISVKSVCTTDFYGRNEWNGEMGDVPAELDSTRLTGIHPGSSAAQLAASAARRTILSMLGFLTWLQSVKAVAKWAIGNEDKEFVKTLRLSERPKAGVMYNLSRDYHEANFIHLLNHDVPIHYPWTDKEKGDMRFLRLSPKYWNEYSVLRRNTPEGEHPDAKDLPSYETWEPFLSRYDWYFQDLLAGKVGEVIKGFKPHWTYRIVDFRYYGAHTVVNRDVIRAYAERFKGIVVDSNITGTVCTFFRQNPLSVDEPAFEREWPRDHEYDLEDFAPTERGEPQAEGEVFYEATSVVRELVKNRWAPREGRTFNTFNDGREGVHLSRSRLGMRSRISGETGEVIIEPALRARIGRVAPEGFTPPMSPTRRSESTGDLGLTPKWTQQMAAGSSRRRSSRSLSPHERDRGLVRRRSASLRSTRTHATSQGPPSLHGDNEDLNSGSIEREHEEQRMSIPSQEAPLHHLPSAPSVIQAFEPEFESREAAVAAIDEWADSVIERFPHVASYPNLEWNLQWLGKGILVSSDPRALTRMKTYTARDERVRRIEEVLELAIRYGLPFSIGIRMGDVRSFKASRISSLLTTTLDALYAPGYVDLPLVSPGADEATLFGIYRGRLNALLARPHAVAFIGMGGITRLVAEYFNEDLVQRFAQGPSLQVTEYQRGRTFLVPNGTDDEFFTTDQVSDSEVAMLMGAIPGSRPGKISTLWPTQEVMESGSLHMRGYVSAGVYKIFWNLKEDMFRYKKYVWRTRAEGKSYFRTGEKGEYAPAVVPTKEDFTIGAQLLDRSFPITWENADLAHLIIPEIFESGSHRD
ncbi:hypothetical protein DFH09DRAFT_1321932 [Mycena vulgaris]|nr:hypothetical protein DFH09DRAFT_1321932 [Mycena vulgaris]